jgi:dolichol kinase
LASALLNVFGYFYIEESSTNSMGKMLFELKRKILHLTFLVPLLMYFLITKYFTKQIGLLFLLFFLLIFLAIEFLRIKQKTKLPLIHIFYRKREKNKLASHIYYLIGAIIAFSVFDFNIAFTALMMTVFGDLSASIIGVSFGKHNFKKIPSKTWEGTIAEFAVNIIIGFIFLQNPIIIFAMALTATFVETVFTHADDNMVIPLFAGFVGQILLMLLNLLRIM